MYNYYALILIYQISNLITWKKKIVYSQTETEDFVFQQFARGVQEIRKYIRTPKSTDQSMTNIRAYIAVILIVIGIIYST